MGKSEKGRGNWTEELVRFLCEQPGIGAVRLDPSAHRIAVATLGQVNLADLEQKLAATISAVEARFADQPARLAAAGFTLRKDGAAVVIGRNMGATAESLWLWREMEWPEIKAEPAPEDQEWRTLAVLAAICGGAGIAGLLADFLVPGQPWLARAFYLVGLVAGAWDAAIDSWENLKKREIDIHFLMLAVAAGAMVIGAWGEAVLLLFLFSASGAMEEYALDRTQREVSSLLKSAPKRATVLDAAGHEHEVAVEELQVGQRVRVRPGGAFPADGLVVHGKSASDEANLTGEATPVEKGVGDQVFSGTLNLWGAVDFEVIRLPGESTLQKIIRLIQTAQKLKAPSERFTDKFGTGYTYAVIGGSFAMFLLWWLGLGLPAFANTGETRSAFYRAMTLMVVASPCALVLSIPSAILAAIAWGAKHGVLFRGGAAIEKLADVNIVALDKTGTLTTGELVVTGYESFPPGRETEVMELAYALESKSEHPLARAIVRDAKARGVRLIELADFRNIVGQGVRGRHGDTQALLGRRELLEAGPLAGWAGQLPPAPADLAEVWVVGKDVLGRVLLRDQIRAESKGVLAKLKALGMRTVMLTGDRRQAAEAVARELGLDEVRAHLTPEQKVAAIQELRQSGGRVAMVGDGVNDAPSLAAADVSVAMGARGSDAALEQAEVILMHDRIENFLAAKRLSSRAQAVIRQNLTISLGVVIIMVIATAFGAVPLAVGVAAHEGSTLIVCLNSLRLLFGSNK
ncbi:heavy metal translocating P-type ATPase [Oleiharenicola lentus]|uniref:Heavy metal translocating P-type ATPase n=1 Tax=Oleiharenicola lentus TaxID=2508720 RepID=A0A4Q1CB56_9BACT|nr:heavy metal translocating P-type ATPase [Oleiharenicola lentus]RXK56294.1 heavy metal translocating P-type ATPase [Oleiharenicola lentus]